MAEKQIAWASGAGYITIIFGGDGNGSVSVASDENVSYDAREQAVVIRTTMGSPEQTQTLLIKQEGKRLAAGTTFKFDYTGAVQSVDLPAGRYKLQCWGAQGGSVTGTYAIAGSKGGYSEGVLELTEPKTLYIFVGGQGTSYTSSASQTSTTVINGGWNGGGAGLRTARYDSGDTDGRSFPRGGGGATDIALVTSTMSYSSGRTDRSSASLLSRIIVAGGGAGASARYTVVTTTTTSTSKTKVQDVSITLNATTSAGTPYNGKKITVAASTTYQVDNFTGTSILTEFYDSSGSYLGKANNSFTTPATCSYIWLYFYDSNAAVNDVATGTLMKVVETTSTDTSTSSGKSSGAQQGGGTSGKGQYPGEQNAAGSGGAFGLGATQSSNNYRYCGGGGGGGWYGGGTNKSDSSTSYVNYSGGGSGFVNTAANASYRPSGYTGIELESGSTTAGNTSHPSISGGSETGHSGNGYAIITVL